MERPKRRSVVAEPDGRSGRIELSQASDRSGDEPPRAAARLLLVEGELEQRAFDLDGSELTLGRTAETSVRLPTARVSRRHCTLELRGGEWWLRDLGSRNGTFLNGVAIRDRRLHDGDHITVADWTFLFSETSAGQAAPSSPRGGHAAGVVTTEELSVEEGLYFDPSALVEERAAGSSGMQGVLRASRLASSARSLPELALGLLPLIFDALPAGRAAVRFELPGMAPYQMARSRDGAVQRLELSETIVGRVLAERVAVLTNRVGEEAALREARSLEHDRVESVLAVPLLAEPTRVLGLLYVDSAAESRVAFRREHLRWLTAVAGIVAMALPRLRHLEWLEREVWVDEGPGLVGESVSLRRILETVTRVAATDTTVLIRGESGTGKELIARALHRASPRRHGPFVAVNCASLSETLLESELFGHERGAFTGAVRRKLGRLEIADGGTLFLDEVGELGQSLQARLLRVLESLEFERVGGTETLRSDLRLVAATNRDLEAAITAGRFREDLFYRLNVVEVRMPPLRERRGDISLLVHHFLALHGHRLERPGVAISRQALQRLEAYDWPGNVRQLSNVIERAVILAAGDWIESEDLPPEVLATSSAGSVETGYQTALDAKKRELIVEAVRSAGGNITAAAGSLQLSPNYLHRLIRNLGLRRAIAQALGKQGAADLEGGGEGEG